MLICTGSFFRLPESRTMPSARPTLFIADLHLSDDTPDLNALFCRFLKQQDGHAAALYILGDFFDAWTGDDDDSRTARDVAAALKHFSRRTPVYFICGNRDFLLGRRYAARAGFTLLPSGCEVRLHGKSWLLSHGDEMCTADRSYQRYRKIVGNRLLQKLFLLLPFACRRRLAAKLRHASRRKQQHRYTPADVSEQGVRHALNGHRAVCGIIHGHTHRPAVHQHDNGTNGRIIRYVLPDWHHGTGGYLAVSADGEQFFRLPDNTPFNP